MINFHGVISDKCAFSVILQVDPASECTTTEEHLLESILATLVDNDEVMSGHAFLEANSGNESCQSLLKMWKRYGVFTYFCVVSLIWLSSWTLMCRAQHLCRFWF